MHDNRYSVRGLAAELVASHRVTHAIGLLFGAVRIEVLTNSPELSGKLSDYYHEFLISSPQSRWDITVTAIETVPSRLNIDFEKRQPDPGKTRIKEEYADISGGRVVRKLLTGMVFIFGGGVNLAVGLCTTHDNQVINFINNRHIEWMLNHGYLLGHAAAVEIEHTGIAIAGVSGTGKSTLALHLMERGACFVSNDRVLVQGEGTGLSLAGVAKLPRVNPGTLLSMERLSSVLPESERTAYEDCNPDALWGIEHKYDVYISRVYGFRRFRIFSTLDMLVMLNWRRQKEAPELRRVDITKNPDAIGAFIKPPGLFYEPEMIDPNTALSQSAYVERLRRCSVYEMTGGMDFNRAADLCCAAALHHGHEANDAGGSQKTGDKR